MKSKKIDYAACWKRYLNYSYDCSAEELVFVRTGGLFITFNRDAAFMKAVLPNLLLRPHADLLAVSTLLAYADLQIALPEIFCNFDSLTVLAGEVPEIDDPETDAALEVYQKQGAFANEPDAVIPMPTVTA